MKKRNMKRAGIPSFIALILCLAIVFLKPSAEESAYDEPSVVSEEAVGQSNDGKSSSAEAIEDNTTISTEYSFRSEKLLNEHFEKHGIEMGFGSKEDYLEAANAVIQNPDSLHKPEAEDGDDVYYLEDTNEFVIVSSDGYIRTYFLPDAGIDYYNRQ